MSEVVAGGGRLGSKLTQTPCRRGGRTPPLYYYPLTPHTYTGGRQVSPRFLCSAGIPRRDQKTRWWREGFRSPASHTSSCVSGEGSTAPEVFMVCTAQKLLQSKEANKHTHTHLDRCSTRGSV